MKVMVACECSGKVREAFRLKGHESWSCDILPSDIPGNHYQCDIFEVLYQDWDLVIAFPPCTDLCVSGARWFKEKQAYIKWDRALIARQGDRKRIRE